MHHFGFDSGDQNTLIKRDLEINVCLQDTT